MAAQLPAPLKSADIQRFILRANQLEKYKPAISYWCNYFAVNKILSKGLHTEGDECMTFTTNLMDKLERIKVEHADNDAIHDDMAAQAFVEQFALETFQRADNAMRSNKTTAQTADTLLASAVFLELLSTWQNPLDQEVAKKIKYAKMHAVRIAKALKAGEDPNLSNPVDDTPLPPAQDIPALDPNDPEVRRIQSLQPTVEEDADDRPPQPLPDMHPEPTGPAQTVPPPAQQVGGGDVSPLEPPSPAPADYFPRMPPTFTAATQPTVPVVDAPAQQPTAPTAGGPSNPLDFYNTPSSPIHPPIPPPSAPRAPSHPQMPSAPSPALPQPFVANPAVTVPAPFPPPAAPQAPLAAQYAAQPIAQPPSSIGGLRRDDESMAQATKHAKWAISALNFDDVDTAVRELRIALTALGAG